MYPQRELTALARRKARLRHAIGLRRVACASSLAQLARPVAWLDQTMALARKLEPYVFLAAVPLGLLLKRSPAARPRLFGTRLRWVPALVGVARGLAGNRHSSRRV